MVPEFQAYVGPQSFEENDKDIFFGRDREVRDLLSTVIANNLVLVYAQSGAGKTSLINAGLIPLLKGKQIEVFPVARVKGPPFKNIKTDEISNIYVFNTLTSWAEGKYDFECLAKMKLVDFLNSREHMLDDYGMPLRRAVIFDQFEEIFSLYQDRWKDREGFFEQVNTALEADPLLRIVFVMREDFIAQLDPYEDPLPERMWTRFHMERLRREDALLAIKEPVKKAGRSFAEGVAEKLVDDLLTIRVETTPGETAEVTGEFIEAVQLQVVCQSLWRELPPDVKQITFQHLKTYGNVEEVLSRFYEEAIRVAAEKAGIDEEGLRRLFDKVLITKMETRGMVYRAPDFTEGVPNAAIDELESRHLIRAEWRAGARWYELTHDGFIKPILSSNKAFNDELAEKELAAEKERAEKELAAERKRAEKERAEKKRAEKELRVEKELAESKRRTIKILVIGSVLCLILAGVAVYQWYLAEHQKQIADNKTKEAEESAKEARALYLNAKSQNLQESPTHLDKSVLLAIKSNKIIKTLDDYELRQKLLLDDDKLIRQELLSIPRSGVVLNHNGPVYKVSFSPDGKYIATASYDNTSRLWDVSTHKQVFVLNHNGSVYDVNFSSDGKYVATASGDNTSRLWNAATGKQIFVLKHDSWVSNVVFSPDGKYLATASGDNTSRLWDAAQVNKFLF